MPRKFPAPQQVRSLGALHGRIARRVGSGGWSAHGRADALSGAGFRGPDPRIHPFGRLPEVPAGPDRDLQPQSGTARPRRVPARDIRPVALLLARLRRHRHPLRASAQLPCGARHRARHEPVHARRVQFVRGMGRHERRRGAGGRPQFRLLHGRRFRPPQNRHLLPSAGRAPLRQHRLGRDDRRTVGHERQGADRDDQRRQRSRPALGGDPDFDPRARSAKPSKSPAAATPSSANRCSSHRRATEGPQSSRRRPARPPCTKAAANTSSARTITSRPNWPATNTTSKTSPGRTAPAASHGWRS